MRSGAGTATVKKKNEKKNYLCSFRPFYRDILAYLKMIVNERFTHSNLLMIRDLSQTMPNFILHDFSIISSPSNNLFDVPNYVWILYIPFHFISMLLP